MVLSFEHSVYPDKLVSDEDLHMMLTLKYSKTCVKWPLSKRPKNVFQECFSLNAVKSIAERFKGSILQNYPQGAFCKMLQREHSAILLTFIKLPVVIKIFVLSSFEWPFYTGFTVPQYALIKACAFIRSCMVFLVINAQKMLLKMSNLFH